MFWRWENCLSLAGFKPRFRQSVGLSLSPYSLYKENFHVIRKRLQCSQSIYKLGIGLWGVFCFLHPAAKVFIICVMLAGSLNKCCTCHHIVHYWKKFQIQDCPLKRKSFVGVSEFKTWTFPITFNVKTLSWWKMLFHTLILWYSVVQHGFWNVIYSRTLDCEQLSLRVFYKTSKNLERILTW
jgi:hypothetical protein